MKTKFFLSLLLSIVTLSASADVQLLFLGNYERHVIERNKKLYWINEGEEDPCFDIQNYKKTGDKETFTLKCKENDRYGQPSTYSVTMTLKNGEPVKLIITSKKDGKKTYDVVTTSGSKYEDQRLKDYFNGLAGNPTTNMSEGVTGTAVPKNPADLKSSSNDPKGTADKVKDGAKETFGKVKGLFKKKDKK